MMAARQNVNIAPRSALSLSALRKTHTEKFPAGRVLKIVFVLHLRFGVAALSGAVLNILPGLAIFFLLPVLFCAETPLRIVSLSPSMTELVYRLGGESSLVGRSSACDFPAQVAELPVAGNFGIPVFSKLLKLRANVLLTDAVRDPEVIRTLEKAGIRVICLPLNNLAGYRKAVLTVGKLLGREDAARGETARIDRVTREYLGRGQVQKKRPKVLFLIWDAPPMAAGSASHLSEYIRLCGGDNVGDCSSRDFFRCSSDWLMQCGAEIILLPGEMGQRRQLRREPFKNLPAARNNRIYTNLDSDVFFRPGPRFEQALEILYSRLHP